MNYNNIAEKEKKFLEKDEDIITSKLNEKREQTESI